MAEFNRPDHDDFWELAAVVQDFDSAAEDGTSLDRLMSPIVDMESVLYMAEQRALRAQRAVNPLVARSAQSELIQLQGTWLDGFAAGALFQKRKMGK